MFDVEYRPGDEVHAQLAALGVDAGDIRYLVNSHLHFDHSGGNHQIPGAQLVVQRREWDAGHEPDQIAANDYDPRNYDLGHDVLGVDGEHDLFGDGSVVCLRPRGTRPGISRCACAAIMATSSWPRTPLPPAHAGRAAPARRAPRPRRDAGCAATPCARCANRGAPIFYGHDPEFWDGTVPQRAGRRAVSGRVPLGRGHDSV